MRPLIAAVLFACAALTAGCDAAEPDPNIALCKTEFTAVLSGTGPKTWPDSCDQLDGETRDDISEAVLAQILGGPVEDDTDTDTEVDD